MTLKSEIIEMCLSFNNVYQDFPFKSKLNYSVIRHRSNKKIFALVYTKDDVTFVNLKAEPMMADLLKQMYKAVVPGYHMNKQHWISVILDGTIGDDEIKRFVSNSFDLTKPSVKQKRKNNTS